MPISPSDLLASTREHSASSVASANCYYYRSSFPNRNGKVPQANTDDSPRPTNGTPAETAANMILRDKMHGKPAARAYAYCTEFEDLRCAMHTYFDFSCEHKITAFVNQTCGSRKRSYDSILGDGARKLFIRD